MPSLLSETRSIMRDHLNTRVPELKFRRVNDTMYVDTFFSSVQSVRGYTCWNLHSYKDSQLDVVHLQQRRSQGLSNLKRCFVANGVPHTVHTDNAREFTSKKWKNYLSSIKSTSTEPFHPNQNLSERRGGTLKSWVVHLLTITCAPVDYWCFCLEYVATLRMYIARRQLDWRTPYEKHFGDTPDVSMLRFTFWQPIWYHNPRSQFPIAKMLKGRFLGFAPDVSDGFCYWIVTEPTSSSVTPKVLSRSVLKPRFTDQQPPVVYTRAAGKRLVFYQSDGKTILPDYDEDPEVKLIVPPPQSLESEESQHITLDNRYEDSIEEALGPQPK